MCIVASTLRKYSHAKILAQNFNSSGLIRIHRSRMCQPDIIRCIGIASTAMHSMNKVWRQTRLQLQTKLRLYQSCILSILLYVSETWTLLQEDLRKLEAFDMRCRRMILGIRWHDFVRNAEVVDRTNLPSVRDVIANRRNSLFGYVVIKSSSDLIPYFAGFFTSYSPLVGRWNWIGPISFITVHT